jgi:PAS domain S-box-containing protein
LTVSAGDRRPLTSKARDALSRTRADLPRRGQLRAGARSGIALGFAIGLAAIAVKAGFNALLGGETGFIVLTGAVALAAWVGGMRGGLSATLTTGLLNAFVFLGQAGRSSELTEIALQRTILYIVAGAVVSLLIASLRSSRDRLATSLTEVGEMAADVERRDERLEMVLAASGTGYWEWDIEDGRLTWSEAIYQQHGLDPGATAPSFERYVQTIHPDDRAAFEAAIEDVLRSGTVAFSQEFRLLWPDGSVHWTHGVGRVFRDHDGKPVRMVGTGTDITERRRLEVERDQLLADERRAGAYREAFLEVISHELRTPITTIFGLTQMLSRPGRVSDADVRAGLIDDINVESERLHRLVEDLLVLTKAEHGQFGIEAEPLELRRLLARVVAHEAGRLPGIEISLEIPRDLPIVGGEDTYVEQIVRNLLGNAAKYTPAGTRVVVRGEQVGEDVAIRVLDSGPGIAPETAARAFELFYRDPTSARTVAGSGIGLFVCASLVKAMGGRIWATSRPEGGSEFGFSLKVLPDDESPGPTAARSGAPSGVGSGS